MLFLRCKEKFLGHGIKKATMHSKGRRGLAASYEDIVRVAGFSRPSTPGIHVHMAGAAIYIHTFSAFWL